jgi:hypothetical protein
MLVKDSIKLGKIIPISHVERRKKSSPPYEGGEAAASADGVVLSFPNPNNDF